MTSHALRWAVLLVTVGFAFCSTTSAQRRRGDVNASGGALLAEQACFDVSYYRLRLRIEPKTKSIAGTLSMVAEITKPTAKIALHLDDRLTVEAVRTGLRSATFEHAAGVIMIDVGEKSVGDDIVVEVDYGGPPRVAPNPPWDGGFTWRTTGRLDKGDPWIATSCQGEGGDLWWPCKDHPSDKPDKMDLEITVPGGLVCASNGTLKATKKNADGTETFHWHIANPISNYNVALNIAPYETVETKYRSIAGEEFPVIFWVLPKNIEKARQILPQFVDHLKFYEDTCGPYPFRNEKYGIVETPHLGMEHQTIIAYGNRFRGLAMKYDWLHHHELAHEWWGNLVTCRDWKDMWIHEGIGTYMQALYLERKFGPKAYEAEMRKTRRGHSNRLAIGPRESMDSKRRYFGGGGNDIYNKGSWIMHTLRWVLGDVDFLRVLRKLAYPDPAKEKVTDGSQVRFSDTAEILAITERVSKKKLDWFFDVYLRQPAIPELVAEKKGDKLMLRWKTPDDLPFPMPVEVKVGEKTMRVAMPKGSAEVVVGEAAYEIDPSKRILKKEERRRRGLRRRR